MKKHIVRLGHVLIGTTIVMGFLVGIRLLVEVSIESLGTLVPTGVTWFGSSLLFLTCYALLEKLLPEDNWCLQRGFLILFGILSPIIAVITIVYISVESLKKIGGRRWKFLDAWLKEEIP